uniref:Uncharacterized protein n=1 Tax=Romanomermis culicivorax TaxID=13658 RepID=A0A915KA16_ROMCU
MNKVEEAATAYGSQLCLYPHCKVAVPLQSYGLHLNVCRRKWRGSIAVCPYNNLHRYGEPERLFHLHVCPDKPANSRFILNKQGGSTKSLKNEKVEDAKFTLKDKIGKAETISTKEKREVPSFNKPEDLLNTAIN